MQTGKPSLVGLLIGMITIVALPAVADSPATVPANGARSTITVRIEALRNNQGTVYVSLYQDKKAFADNKNALASGQAKPTNQTAQVEFKNIVPGNYALSFIHDENNNQKLDTNFIGIPKEGFGFSKDATGKFGPPKYDDAVVNVPAGPVTIVMRTKYM
jgi:uncharacterized protein (DUF2141 family)